MGIRYVLPFLLAGVYAMAQSAGTFTATGSMTTARSSHTATLLTNGKVLIAGGEVGFNPLATAELYDPVSGTFTRTGDMTAPRYNHTATLLPDGRVLIAGGSRVPQADIPTTSAEIYDPATGTFAATANMIFGRVCQQANLLGNGKVLLVGGSGASGEVPNGELYDPATATFAPAGTYASDVSGFNTCQGAVTSLLPDGRVLIVWEEDTAEIYDPDAGSFTTTAKSVAPSYSDGLPIAASLMNGEVLVAGGAWDGDLSNTSAGLYDSGPGAFTVTANMVTGHVQGVATPLPDGTVLIAGGFLFPGTLPNAEIYSPAAGAFTAVGNMTMAREGQQANLLNDGRVLVTGGAVYPAELATAELYHPAVLVPAPVLFAVWHAQTGEVATAGSPAVAGEALSMYTANLSGGGGGGVIPPQVAVGGRLAQVLYFGDAPGYPGYSQVNFRVPSGVTPGAAVAVRLTYLNRSSNAVTIGVQ